MHNFKTYLLIKLKWIIEEEISDQGPKKVILGGAMDQFIKIALLILTAMEILDILEMDLWIIFTM